MDDASIGASTLESVHGSGIGLQFSLRVEPSLEFPMVRSSWEARGQVMDLLILWDLLEQGGHLSDPLKDYLRQCLDLNEAPNLASFESACADLLSLARRMNWGQLSAFMGKISGKNCKPWQLRLLWVPIEWRFLLHPCGLPRSPTSS